MSNRKIVNGHLQSANNSDADAKKEDKSNTDDITSSTRQKTSSAQKSKT